MSPLPLPPDHDTRLERARLALDGLSVGDAFGGQFFIPGVYQTCFASRQMPEPPWHWTDDTEMALGIFEVLRRHGHVEQDELAAVFARRFDADFSRGYGPGAIRILAAIHNGTPWRDASRGAFDGIGSLGNGGAMRVAPVGAYFADDLGRVAEEARASAEVTHAHPEGQAGAIAVAVAGAWAWRVRDQRGDEEADRLLDAVLEHTPAGETRAGLERARALPLDMPLEAVVSELGNGSQVTAPDTVPFTLWCAARHLRDFVGALWTTVAAGGDVDTTCAIVGGVVILAADREAIPRPWLEAREPLDFVGGRSPIVPP